MSRIVDRKFVMFLIVFMILNNYYTHCLRTARVLINIYRYTFFIRKMTRRMAIANKTAKIN